MFIGAYRVLVHYTYDCSGRAQAEIQEWVIYIYILYIYTRRPRAGIEQLKVIGSPGGGEGVENE